MAAHRWDHDAPPQTIKGRSCYVVLLRSARGPRASGQALLYCCAVPVVPGPAAVVALPAATSRLVATKPECVRRLKAQRVRCDRLPWAGAGTKSAFNRASPKVLLTGLG